MPPIAEPTKAPAAHGAVLSAECQGEKPSSACRKTLKISTIPPIEPTNTSENPTPEYVAAPREDAGLNQRCGARTLAAHLVPAEHAQDRHGGHEQPLQPQRPAQLVTLDACRCSVAAGSSRAPATSASTPTGT
jgi:hypothetical protein